jgi:ketosteroid isomerase-like protein
VEEFRQPEIGEVEYHGREGVARGIEELPDVFDDVRAEPEDFFVAGPHVVVFVRLSGVARGSGVAVELALAHAFRFRGEQVDRWHAYADRAEALKAVGMEE